MVIDPVQILAPIAKVTIGTRREQDKPQPDGASAVTRGTAVEIVPPGRETAQQLVLKEILGSLDGIIRAEGFPPLADIDPAEFSMEKVVERVLARAEAFLLQAGNRADFDHVLGEVRKGIERGFERANIVLGDLGSLDNEEIVADIEETSNLIRDGLTRLSDNFITRLLEQSDAETVTNLADPAPATDSGPAAGDPEQTPT